MGGQVVQDAQGGQEHVAVPVEHALGSAGGAGGVEDRERVGLLHLPGLVRDLDPALLHQFFVGGRAGFGAVGTVCQPDPVGKERSCLGQGLFEPFPDKEPLDAGMLDGVKQVIGGEPEVDGEQDGAEHGTGIVQFQVTVAVDVHHADDGAAPHTELLQVIGQPYCPLVHLLIGKPARFVDDLRPRPVAQRALQHFVDDQSAHRPLLLS